MTAIGVVLWALAAIGMFALYLRCPHRCPYPHYGYLGLAVIIIAEALMFRGAQPVSTFFTAIAWTGYIAVVDAAVFSLAGISLLHGHGRALIAITVVSAPLWLIFEAYNLRLQNWAYINLPRDRAIRYFGYAWAFSTIWPAVLETAYLFRAARLWERNYPPVRFPSRLRDVLPPLGAAMLVLPLLLPRALAPYLFGLVWLGFIFLLDPVNSRLGGASLLDDLEQGRRARLYSLLVAGGICGIFWEFWNYWAFSKWVYVFPILQNAKIFEMPVPGYLGFLPFALEYFAMYVFLAVLAQRITGARRLNYVPDF